MAGAHKTLCIPGHQVNRSTLLAPQGILVSPRMVEDHSCLTLVAALRDASASAGRLGAAEYFPPTVPGADDAHAAERPPGGSKGGDTALLSALL